MDAGVCEQNLVAVSSVLPDGIVEVQGSTLPMGAVTHCVLSQSRGSGGERISAGIGFAFRSDGFGGYVAEDHHHGSKDFLEARLGEKIEEIFRIRDLNHGPIRFQIEELDVPEGHYGCCVSALVFTRYRKCTE